MSVSLYMCYRRGIECFLDAMEKNTTVQECRRVRSIWWSLSHPRNHETWCHHVPSQFLKSPEVPKTYQNVPEPKKTTSDDIFVHLSEDVTVYTSCYLLRVALGPDTLGCSSKDWLLGVSYAEVSLKYHILARRNPSFTFYSCCVEEFFTFASEPSNTNHHQTSDGRRQSIDGSPMALSYPFFQVLSGLIRMVEGNFLLAPEVSKALFEAIMIGLFLVVDAGFPDAFSEVDRSLIRGWDLCVASRSPC